MIRLQFVLGYGMPSQAIAWFSAGHFSHVDAVLQDGTLLGARSDSIGGKPPGVQIRYPLYEKWKERVVMSIATDAAKEKSFYDFLNAQLGKPYDKTAIWGFATGRDWRDPSDWYCSELITAAEEAAGALPALYVPSNKVTPVMCAALNSAIGASVS
jgi:uncharacterized protein YycO